MVLYRSRFRAVRGEKSFDSLPVLTCPTGFMGHCLMLVGGAQAALHPPQTSSFPNEDHYRTAWDICHLLQHCDRKWKSTSRCYPVPKVPAPSLALVLDPQSQQWTNPILLKVTLEITELCTFILSFFEWRMPTCQQMWNADWIFSEYYFLAVGT